MTPEAQKTWLKAVSTKSAELGLQKPPTGAWGKFVRMLTSNRVGSFVVDPARRA
jgi:hypothetical protein